MVNNAKEEWKPLMYGDLDLTDRYLVSNTGKLYSLKSKKILKTVIHKEGYEVVCISLGSRKNKKLIRIHVAVANMFVDGYKDGLRVNHIDGNKLNNDSSNLEWVTYSENSQHAAKMGLFIPVNRKPVKQIDIITGKTINIYKSIREAQEKIGKNIKGKNISNVIHGRSKTAYGYRWECI